MDPHLVLQRVTTGGVVLLEGGQARLLQAGGGGVDLAARVPEALTADAVQPSDLVITTGRGDACPVFPGKRYLDWVLPGPAGQGVEAVRPIRDRILRHVEDLLAELPHEPA